MGENEDSLNKLAYHKSNKNLKVREYNREGLNTRKQGNKSRRGKGFKGTWLERSALLQNLFLRISHLERR